jgi:2-iminoacetate synthase
MDNNYFVDSAKLSKEALAKKHELETNPASRADIMAYLPEWKR